MIDITRYCGGVCDVIPPEYHLTMMPHHGRPAHRPARSSNRPRHPSVWAQQMVDNCCLSSVPQSHRPVGPCICSLADHRKACCLAEKLAVRA
jgi:hypothetical protein